MTTIAVQKIPNTWDDARDVPFFRITARLFTPDFCLCASVLLASYEADTYVIDQPTHDEAGNSTSSATGDIESQYTCEGIPVLVRRTR